MTRKLRQKAPGTEPHRPSHCDSCGRAVAGFESVHYGSNEGGFRDLCNRCFNQEVADAGEIDFSHVQFEPLDLKDAAGVMHRFHFQVRLGGDHVALEASEFVDGAPGGFQFQVMGDPEEDLFELMGRMVPRIRRLIGQQHLKTEPYCRDCISPISWCADVLLGMTTRKGGAHAGDRRASNQLGAVRKDGDGFRGVAIQTGDEGSERGDMKRQRGTDHSGGAPLHPTQFQVNEAWIVFRLNESPIHTEQEGSFNCFCLMDAASCFLLGTELIPSRAAAPSQQQARQLLAAAWAHKGEFPQTLFVLMGMSVGVMKLEAERLGVAVLEAPEDQFLVFIGEARDGYREHIQESRKP